MHRIFSSEAQKLATNVRSKFKVRQLTKYYKRQAKADVTIGDMDASDELGRSLQAAVESNRIKKLQKLLDSGVQYVLFSTDGKVEDAMQVFAISVIADANSFAQNLMIEVGTTSNLQDLVFDIDIEYANSLGQTPLYCASAKNNYDGAVLLLKYGADPNTRDVNGTTPLHIAVFMGNIRLLCRMIESGGDLSLYNDFGEGVYEWAAKIGKPKIKLTMTEFLDKVRLYGELLTSYKGTFGYPIKLPKHAYRPMKQSSIMEILAHKTRSATSSISFKSNESHGFGQVYPFSKAGAGILSVVPLISDRMLVNVTNNSFECNMNFTMKEYVNYVTQYVL